MMTKEEVAWGLQLFRASCGPGFEGMSLVGRFIKLSKYGEHDPELLNTLKSINGNSSHSLPWKPWMTELATLVGYQRICNHGVLVEARRIALGLPVWNHCRCQTLVAT